MKVLRTGADGVERIAFIGYVSETIPEGDTMRIKVKAPESLITEYRDAPFQPPLAEHVREPKVFDFFWKQIDYVFSLADPRRFPPLPVDLTADERTAVERYVRVASDLASSQLLNSVREGFNVRIPDGPSGAEELEIELSGTDVQGGFAALLRQCDSTAERASFERVRSILYVASDAAADATHDVRLAELEAWRRAIGGLHAKSLNQLLRDKLVREERMGVFEYEEEHSPQQLLSIYNYGDLLHWGDRSHEVRAWETDPYVDLDRRLAYLDAACALAHLYIGFAELARSAIGRVVGSAR